MRCASLNSGVEKLRRGSSCCRLPESPLAMTLVLLLGEMKEGTTGRRLANCHGALEHGCFATLGWACPNVALRTFITDLGAWTPVWRCASELLAVNNSSSSSGSDGRAERRCTCAAVAAAASIVQAGGLQPT